LIKEELEIDDKDSIIRPIWSKLFLGNMFKLRAFCTYFEMLGPLDGLDIED
jgi:hypothetical protein